MNIIDIWIEGITSLLQRRYPLPKAPSSDTNAQQPSSTRASPRAIAEEAAYRDTDGNLFLPPAAIMELLRKTRDLHNPPRCSPANKLSVAAAVSVIDPTIPLYAKDKETRLREFEIDARPVIIPKTGVRMLRYRPRLDVWTANFVLAVDDDLLPTDTVRQLLVDGGRQIGVGDFRPERGGHFGIFRVVGWNDGSNGTSEVAA